MTKQNVTTESVWTMFSDRLRAFIAKRVQGPSDVDDVLQNVFARIHEGLGGLRESEKLEPWLFQVARRSLLDHFRSRSGKRRTDELPEDLSRKPSAATISAEVASWLVPMMSQLSEEDRTALQLADLEGISQKDLAARLGISLTGAKSRVQRARVRLREVLLECCHIDLDRRGNAVEYTAKKADCGPCSCS